MNLQEDFQEQEEPLIDTDLFKEHIHSKIINTFEKVFLLINL